MRELDICLSVLKTATLLMFHVNQREHVGERQRLHGFHALRRNPFGRYPIHLRGGNRLIHQTAVHLERAFLF